MWDPSPADTLSKGLSYNLTVTDANTGKVFVSPVYGSPLMGNQMLHSPGTVQSRLDLPDSATYKWSVAAVSPALQLGAQASGTFTIPPLGPSSITNLTADQSGQIHLTWTAAGESGSRGTLKQYTLYYATAYFDTGLESWVKPPIVYDTNLLPGGKTENREVSNIVPGQIYYFRLLAQDHQGLTTLSNISSATASHFSLQQPIASANAAFGSLLIGPWTAPGSTGRRDDRRRR